MRPRACGSKAGAGSEPPPPLLRLIGALDMDVLALLRRHAAVWRGQLTAALLLLYLVGKACSKRSKMLCDNKQRLLVNSDYHLNKLHTSSGVVMNE
jgi:hypothetical protein